MPYTYPRFSAELTTYDYKVSEEVDKMEGAYDYDAVVSVQWPFGFGKSYTSFQYSNLKVSNPRFTPDEEIVITVDVCNTGDCAGKEVVMLFSSDKVASLVPDKRRLRAFDKISLDKGEKKSVTFKLSPRSLAFVNAEGDWVIEKGDFLLQCGTETVEITCSETRKF